MQTAIDAYVLLEVYSALIKRGQSLGLSKSDLEPQVTLRVRTNMDKRREKAGVVNKSGTAQSVSVLY